MFNLVFVVFVIISLFDVLSDFKLYTVNVYVLIVNNLQFGQSSERADNAILSFAIHFTNS